MIFIFCLKNGYHVDELILRYNHEQKDVILDLKLNHNFIPRNHFMRYQLPNGTDVVQHFSKTDVDLCHYKVSVIFYSSLLFVWDRHVVFTLSAYTMTH